MKGRISRRFSLRPGSDGDGLRGERRVVRRDEGEGSMLGLMFIAWLVCAVVVAVDYRRARSRLPNGD